MCSSLNHSLRNFLRLAVGTHRVAVLAVITLRFFLPIKSPQRISHVQHQHCAFTNGLNAAIKLQRQLISTALGQIKPRSLYA